MDMERLQIAIQNAGFKGSVLTCTLGTCTISIPRGNADPIVVHADGSFTGQDDTLAAAIAAHIATLPEFTD
jgi:uncharacterized membrane protein